MANEASTTVVIEVDLDKASHDKAFDELKDGAEEGGSAAGDASGKKYKEQFNKQIKQLAVGIGAVIALEFSASRIVNAFKIQAINKHFGKNIKFAEALQFEFARFALQSAHDFKNFLKRDIIAPAGRAIATVSQSFQRGFQSIFGGKVLKKAASNKAIAGLLAGPAQTIDADFTRIKDTLGKAGEAQESFLKKTFKSQEGFINFGKTAKAQTQSVSTALVVLNENTNKSFSFDDLSSKFKSFFRDFKEGASGAANSIKHGFLEVTDTAAGVAVVLGALSMATNKLSMKMKESENGFISFAGTVVGVFSTIAKAAAIAFGSFGVLVPAALVLIAGFVNKIAGEVVEVFKQATDKFAEFEKQTLTFTKTLENFQKTTGGQVGSLDSWNKKIDEMSQNFNVSIKTTRKAAQEIVSVGAQFGFAESELQKLLKISIEYAKVNGKDVFDTSVKMLGALNGNSQAVQALGIKLDAATLQQYAYKTGIEESISTMSSSQKVHLRYNKLLSQYKNITGIAAAAAGTLSGQSEKLAVNQERLNIALGSGAAYIENNQIGALALNTVLNNVSGEVLKVTGFLGALGARFIQITSLIVKYTVRLFLLIEAYKALQGFLVSDFGSLVLNKNIPLLNKSFMQLFSTMSGGKTEIKSVKGLVTGLAEVVKGRLSGAIDFAIGTSIKGKGVFATLGIAIKSLSSVLISASGALWVFLAPLLVIVAKIALVVAALYGVYKVLEEVEKRTKFFSTTWDILVTAFTEGKSIFDPVTKLFEGLGTTVANVARKSFGMLVQKSTQFFGLLAKFGASNPFGMFGQKTVNKFVALEMKMDSFSDKVKLAGYDLGKLKKDINRAPAGKSYVFKKIEELAQLKSAMKDFGKSSFQIIKEQEEKRLQLITDARRGGMLLERDFQTLKNNITKDSAAQVQSDLLLSMGMFHQTQLERINQQEIDRKLIADSALAAEAISKQAHEDLITQIESDAATKRLKNKKKADKKTKQEMGNIGKALVDIVGGTAQAFGREMVNKGSASMQGFLGLVLDVFGGVAIAIGTSVIASIKAIQGLKASIVGTGAVGIALALGLIAVGAAMKAQGAKMQGGGSSSGSSFGSSGGGLATGGGSSGSASFGSSDFTDDKERSTQSNVINLTVSGNIVDSDEEGTRIANVLKKSFNKDGIVLNNARFA